VRDVLCILLVLAASRLVVAPAAVGQQQGRLPWRAGDAPPTVAGLGLGAARRTIDSVLGAPESVRALSPGVEMLRYDSRGIALVYSKVDSLAVAYLVTREAGNVGGTRVGDTRDSVVARWGDPTGVQDNTTLYQVGRWAILVWLDSTRSRVRLLGVARVAEEPGAEAAGPYDSTADARQDIDAALRESRNDHKLVLLDFGANWCLDCLVLDRLLRDSTVAPYLGANFRVVHVEVGRFDRNLEISRAYGSPIEGGVPAVVVLSPAGVVVATTKDGSLESARTATAAQILRFLHSWVAAARR
jgi:thioredoxin 1